MPKPNYKSGGGDGPYEQVAVGEMLPGKITEVIYEEKHTFKGWKGGPDTVGEGVRIVIMLDGYKMPHGTGFMKFNYGEKANLYKKFLSKLVENAHPDMCDFDIDGLKNLRIKVLFNEPEPGKQYIESVFIDGKKAPYGAPTAHPVQEEEHEPPVDDTDIPF